MKEFKICLNTIDKVKEFVNIATRLEPDMDIIVGRYIIDAKSIMGIFSIDLSRVLTLRIESSDIETCEEIKNKLGKFIVEE